MGKLSAQAVRLVAGERTLFERLDFEIGRGSLCAIVGPNGVGKTTLLRALAGFTEPGAGRIALEDTPVRSLTRAERARALTLIGDDAETPPGMSVREVVLMGRFARRAWWDWTTDDDDVRAAGAALERVALDAFAERPFDTLSSGERQRAWLALALAQNATTILLDEPTSHLDVRHAAEVAALLRSLAAEGRTVVAVLHDLNEAAAFADDVIVLGEGTLLAHGTPATALTPANLESAFGVAFERVTVAGSLRVFAR